MQTKDSRHIRRKGGTEGSQAPPPPSADAVGAQGTAAVSLAARLPPLLLLLITGTLSTVIAQRVLNQDIADNSVQHLAVTKFVAILALSPLSGLWRFLRRAVGLGGADPKRQAPADEPPTRRSRRATQLMLALAALDVTSYFVHCVGFALCGSAVATVVFAATAQLLTAAMTRYVLKRRLLKGQRLAVMLVSVGILLRGVAFSMRPGGGGKGTGSGQWWGIAAMLASAVGYSSMGVIYDLLVRTEQPAPSHTEIMVYISRLGLVVSVVYQLVYTLPRWQTHVSAHLEGGGTSGVQALALLGLFGAIYNVHSFAQGRVQRMEGALGAGLVAAVRSATVSLASGLLFCSPSAPSQCLTPLSFASAAVVTAGGVAWVTAKPPSEEKPKRS